MRSQNGIEVGLLESRHWPRGPGRSWSNPRPALLLVYSLAAFCLAGCLPSSARFEFCRFEYTPNTRVRLLTLRVQYKPAWSRTLGQHSFHVSLETRYAAVRITRRIRANGIVRGEEVMQIMLTLLLNRSFMLYIRFCYY